MRSSNLILLWLSPHSFTAWALGFKDNPLDIIYGGWSWQNLVFFANIDENVNYVLINQLGHPYVTAITAFAGPGIVVLSIYLITLYLLRKNFNSYFYALIFWINLVNLQELWAYVPLRALSTTADIANINHSLGISPWWIFIIITPLVIWAVLNFFSNTLQNAFEKLGLFSISSKVTLFIITIIYFFGLTGLQILTANYNAITNTLTWYSFIAIPFILFFYWPKRKNSAYR